MKKGFMFLGVALTVFIVSSCSVSVDEYPYQSQAFNISNYFDGKITGWGTVQDYRGKVIRRFCVDIIGTWQGNSGTLAESFYFDDGEISFRNWQLTQNQSGQYQGHAEDIIGTAYGEHKGFAFNFRYQLLLTLGDNTYQVSMDDWMYQLSEHKVINKTSMSKLGIEVANITLFFDKSNPDQSCKYQ